MPAPPVSFDHGIAGAIESRGDYRAAVRRIEQADLQLAAARRTWIPTLVFTGGLKTSDMGAQTATGYTGGIGFGVPLFDYGQADRARALARRTEAQAVLRVLKWRLPSIIQIAYDSLVQRTAQARHYTETQLPRLQGLVRRAEVSYQEGERGVFELLDAYRTARDTRLHAIELRREAKRSELELWRALGKRPGSGR
jgi:outer membrane protein TolC